MGIGMRPRKGLLDLPARKGDGSLLYGPCLRTRVTRRKREKTALPWKEEVFRQKREVILQWGRNPFSGGGGTCGRKPSFPTKKPETGLLIRVSEGGGGAFLGGPLREERP